MKLYQHHCKQMDELVHVGDTKRGTPVWLNKHAVEADKIIVIDGITPHLFAGYGGGRKLILPGVPEMRPSRSTTATLSVKNSAPASIRRPAPPFSMTTRYLTTCRKPPTW